jgi:hypothetical protein
MGYSSSNRVAHEKVAPIRQIGIVPRAHGSFDCTGSESSDELLGSQDVNDDDWHDRYA